MSESMSSEPKFVSNKKHNRPKMSGEEEMIESNILFFVSE